jgi:hypothetical protein
VPQTSSIEQGSLVANGLGIELPTESESHRPSTTPILVKLTPHDVNNSTASDPSQRDEEYVPGVTRWHGLNEDSIASFGGSVVGGGMGTPQRYMGTSRDKNRRCKSQQIQRRKKRGGPDFRAHVENNPVGRRGYGNNNNNNNDRNSDVSPTFAMCVQVVPNTLSMSSKMHMSARPHTSSALTAGKRRANAEAGARGEFAVCMYEFICI